MSKCQGIAPFSLFVGNEDRSMPPSRPADRPTVFDFASDNTAGLHPDVMEALIRVNRGFSAAYGADELSLSLGRLFSDIFEHECFVYPTPTGTAANGLALAAITPSWGAILTHGDSHIVVSEGGAPEFFTHGARLLPLKGEAAKISPAGLRAQLERYATGNIHHLRATTLSLTQATECGTVYRPEELTELLTLAGRARLKVHMDGARFANALVRLGATPAEMTWKAGIDTVAFGTSKNGTMNTEAVLTFDPEIACVLRAQHKRAGLLTSKMRFMSAQLAAYLDGDLWLENARAANRSANRLASALLHLPGVRLLHPVETNQVFSSIPDDVSARLSSGGFHLRPWPDSNGSVYRLVASFCDEEAHIEAFERLCARVANEGSSDRCGG